MTSRNGCGTIGAVPEHALIVEELAANAWPAGTVQYVEGWRLRHTPEVQRRRSNSVLPPTHRRRGGLAAAEVLDIAEDFYARRGLPLVVQVSPAETRRALDQDLERRGLRATAHTVVLTADIDEVSAPGDAARDLPAVQVGDLTDAWLEAWGAVENRSDVEATRRSVLARIGPPSGYAEVVLDGEIAAVGLGVVERAWAGLFCMGTRPVYRRLGAGRAVLRGLAEWARRHDATRLYLQVEADNAAARHLYADAGFAHSHSYHYRTAAGP